MSAPPEKSRLVWLLRHSSPAPRYNPYRALGVGLNGIETFVLHVATTRTQALPSTDQRRPEPFSHNEPTSLHPAMNPDREEC